MPDPLQISEALDEELELLQEAYPPSALAIQDSAHPVTATLSISMSFASATVTVVYPVGYPSTPATVTMSSLQGGCVGPRSPAPLLSSEFSGSSALAKAVAWVHECNIAPTCGACSRPFPTDLAARGPEACIVLEPCLHALHAKKECFGAWYQTQIRQRREMEARLTNEVGIGEAERRAMEGWPKCVTCTDAVDDAKAKKALRVALGA